MRLLDAAILKLRNGSSDAVDTLIEILKDACALTLQGSLPRAALFNWQLKLNKFRTWKRGCTNWSRGQLTGALIGAAMKHRFLRSWLERIANRGNSGCYVFRQRSGKLIYLRGTDALRVIRQLYVRYTITDMPRAIYVVLCLSIAANLFLVALGSFFLHRRGGMSSIRFRLGSGIELRNVNVASSPRRSFLIPSLTRLLTLPLFFSAIV